jgi:hypothetical protein
MKLTNYSALPYQQSDLPLKYGYYFKVIIFVIFIRVVRGTLLVAQLVEALRYKPEGRGFDSRLCHWNISLTSSFRPHCDPGIDSTSNRNEYQEYFLGVKAAGA